MLALTIRLHAVSTEIKVILKLPACRAHKLYPEHCIVSCFGLYSYHNVVICWYLVFDVSTLSYQLGLDDCRHEIWSVWWKCIGHTGLLFCVCFTAGEIFCLLVSWQSRIWRIEFTLLSNQNVFCNHWTSVCVCVILCWEYICMCGTRQQYTAGTSSEYEVDIEMDFMLFVPCISLHSLF